MPKFIRNRSGIPLAQMKGFSLVEMLIYIAVLVLMLGVIFQVVVSINNSDRKIAAARNVENSAASALERISRETRAALSIEAAQSILSTHPGKLILKGKDAMDNDRTVEFFLSGTQLRLKENGVDTGALTGVEAPVTRLVFYRFFTPTTEGIRVEITIQSGTSTAYRSEKFYSSAILR